MRIKIEGVGKNGDPFGKDANGKIVFIKGNRRLSMGTVVECDISSEYEKFSVARFGKVLSENPMKGEQNSANPRLPFQQRLQTCQTPLRQERQSWQIGSNDNVRLAYSTGDSIQTDIPTGLEDMRDINNILSPEQKILLSENAQARETLKNFIREIERPNIHNKIREK